MQESTLDFYGQQFFPKQCFEDYCILWVYPVCYGFTTTKDVSITTTGRRKRTYKTGHGGGTVGWAYSDAYYFRPCPTDSTRPTCYKRDGESHLAVCSEGERMNLVIISQCMPSM